MKYHVPTKMLVIVLRNLMRFFTKKSFYHQGFFAVKRRAVFILLAMPPTSYEVGGKRLFFMFLFQSPSISPLSQRQPIITMITGCPSYPRRESNPDLRFRKPSFYPLNYGGIA